MRNGIRTSIPCSSTSVFIPNWEAYGKATPSPVLIKKAAGIEKGSGVPNKNKVASISKADVQKIAETKMPDLNAASLEAAMSMIAGTARSMGVTVEE